MATKFYLHNAASTVAGTLPSTEQSSLTPDANFFTGVTDADNKSMDTTKSVVSQSNLTNSSTADTSSHNYYICKWVSPIIQQARISAQTWSFEYAAKESNAAANFPVTTSAAGRACCYVWQPSTGTKIGNILDANTGTVAEAGTTQTVISGTFTGSEVTGIKPGDAVIVFELWAIVTQGNGTARTQDIYFDGTTEGSTTNEAAFISTPENLQFAADKMADNATLITGSTSGGTITANTTQYWSVVGDYAQNMATAETDVKTTIRESGTLKNLICRVQSNTVAGTSSITLMKNGSASALTVSIPSSGAADWYEDLTHSVTVSAGDTISYKSVPGAATGTYSVKSCTMHFVPDDTTKYVTIMGAQGNNTYATASTTKYISIGGRGASTSTEAQSKQKQRVAGTYSKLYVYVSSNARTTNTTFKSRKNGADGNLTVTYASGETGVKEDTAHSDTVAVNDDWNLAITTSTGTENIVYQVIKVEFACDYDVTTPVLSSHTGSSADLAANTTYYIPIGGYISNQTSATDFRRRTRQNQLQVSELHAYVNANTITANSTVTLQKKWCRYCHNIYFNCKYNRMVSRYCSYN